MNICIKNLFIRNFFSFKGRASRKEYVYRVLLTTFIFVTWSYSEEFINQEGVLSFLYVVIFGNLGVLMLFQYFPLAVRRLHDLNSSGWFVLISFVPFGQLLILWLMFKKGTDGVNDYGEPPRY